MTPAIRQSPVAFSKHSAPPRTDVPEVVGALTSSEVSALSGDYLAEELAHASLSDAAIFQGVDADARLALSKQLQRVDFRRGRAVYTEGEQGDRLYIILSGKVKLGNRSRDGREEVLTLLGPPDMFGELSIFDPGPRTSTATAVTSVRAASMDGDAMRTWITERPEMAEQLLRVLARRLRRTNDVLADLIFTDVPGRVAKQLLDLAERFGTPHGDVIRVKHDLRQEEIAQLVGSSRETVNKALADFAQSGWIQVGVKYVVITNVGRLRHRSHH